MKTTLEYIAESIARNVPLSGSGFSELTFERMTNHTKKSQRSLRFTATYQPMNEIGFYDGLVKFRVIIPLDSAIGDLPRTFGLQLCGDLSLYYAGKYDLRDYIEQHVADSIEQWLRG